MGRQQIAECRLSVLGGTFGSGSGPAPDPVDPDALLRLMARQPNAGDRVGPIVGRLRPSGHHVAFTVEYRRQAYRVVELVVTPDRDKELTSADLGLPVKEAAEQVLSGVWAMFGSHAKGDEFGARQDDFRGRQRGRLPDEFLRRVAETYLQAEADGAPSVIDAVATRHRGHYTTAQRWVAAARKAGHLPPAVRGRRPIRKQES
ncbi:MAG: hypothetical protein ACT4QF_00230 [Sporichthyaceae bacterium]